MIINGLKLQQIKYNKQNFIVIFFQQCKKLPKVGIIFLNM